MVLKRWLIIFMIAVVVPATFGQQIRVQGLVRDVNTHREISSVNIFIKETQIGTTSDYTGSFLLVIPRTTEGDIVVFRHVGYEVKEVGLDSLRGIQVIYLQPRVIQLPGVQIEEEKERQFEIEKDIPQTISMVESKSFEIRGYVDAGDLLKMDHSIQVEEELSGKKMASIRGGNPDEIVVLYNGIKMNRAYDNTFDLSLIDLEDIERFEIIKGSNTALYGPEAFSGVINIVPKFQHDYHIRFQQRFGTYQSGNWGLHFYHNYKRIHGSYGIKQGGLKRTFADAEDEERADLTNKSLHHTANLNYHLSEHPDGRPANFLGLMYTYTSLDYENERDVENLNNYSELVSLKYTGDISRVTDLNLSVSFLRFREQQFLASGTGVLDRRIKDQAIHVNAEKGMTLGLLDFLVAYQFEHVELDFTDERSNFREQNIGLESAIFTRQHHGLISIVKLNGYIDSDLLKKTEISVSLRHDRVRDGQDDAVLRSTPIQDKGGETVGLFGENAWNETMFKFGMNLSGHQKDLTFEGYINFGSNTKFPTLFQQISSPALLTQGVYANLNPEKNRSVELSVSVAKDIRNLGSIYGWQISGNFFQNLYENKFRVSTTPGIPVPFYDNVEDARISGLETKSSVFLFRKKIAVELGMSRYFISEKAAFPFKSEFKNTIGFIIDHAGYSFQLHWFKEGEQVGWLRQRDGQFAAVALPEFSNIDLHLSKRFTLWKMKLFANVSGRNLLNDEAVLLQGLAIRDRRYYMTVGMQY